MKNALRGSLAALIPLAATAVANAQCQGGIPGTISVNSNAGFYLDVDGGGNDFLFHNSSASFLVLKRLGTNQILISGIAVKRLASAYTITVNKNFFDGNQFRSLCDSSSGTPGQFNVGHATPAFIGIKKGTVLGFIQLQVTDCGPGTMQFKIPEMGYENDGNSNVITGQCTTLPVEMLYFRAASQAQRIRLEWATATEQNNDGFEVQRSIDGRMFLKIGWVAGQGSTVEERHYSFTDKTALPNTTYYYQLKQLDQDGNFEFSPIRTAMVKDENRVEVSEFAPNVVKSYGGSWLTINLPEATDADITFFDGRGVPVKSLQRSLEAGRNKFVLHVQDLIGGNYFVKIQMGREVVYRRLVVR